MHRPILFAAAALLVSALPGVVPAVAGKTAEVVELPNPQDAISPVDRAKIEAAVAAYEKRRKASGSRAEAEGPFRYPFYPQAGILGKDLFVNNYADLDPSNGLVRDWDCSFYTYDGHHGHDSLIRSFREQLIGVPVFAVLDGVVVTAHDGEPDMNTVWTNEARANYVIIDHGGGYIAWYYHFKRGSVAVSAGQEVRAGQQIGLTGSSGFSNWPHLHFETRSGGTWVEPSAGPCRSGDSLWESQAPIARDFYVGDFYLSPGAISIPTYEAYLLDEAPRTGSFVKGQRTVGLRTDLRNLPTRSTYRISVLNPRGRVVDEISGGFGNSDSANLYYLYYAFNLNLDTVGNWRVRMTINDSTVDAPFRVVNSANQAKNRPPKKVAARLTPRNPVEGRVMTCTVQTSFVTEDPDYDLVRYRYEWKVNGRTVRTVTSAALSDLLATGVARPRDRVSCKVTPSDGQKSGPATTAASSISDFEE